MRPYFIGATVACCVLWTPGAAHGAESAATPFTEPARELALPEALAYTLEHNLGLAVFAWDIRAAEARAIQAALRPNPGLTVELEDIRLGGSSSNSSERGVSLSAADGPALSAGHLSTGARRGTLGDAELTASLSQIIELGGKRAKRIAVANRERDLAAWDYEIARADALTETARAFYAVLAAQERIALSDGLLELAGQAHETIKTLVDAGKASAIELSRSQVELGQLEVASESARRELNAARIELAAQWGNADPVFTEALGTFPETFVPNSPGSVREAIRLSPYLKRWTAEMEMRDAVVTLEKANARSDVTVTFGVRATGVSGERERAWNLSTADGIGFSRSRRDSDTETGLVLGVSIPLPLFNRNQGAVKEAEYLSAKAAHQQRAVDAEINAALAAAMERALGAHDRAGRLEVSIIPAASEAFAAVQEGYRAGKFGLLDVVVAQRALFDARVSLAESQAAFLQTLVEIERFTGLPVEPAQPTPGAATPEN
jgi:cobalt-zinc-cadmium efflux system outer membrane protein